MMLLHAVVFPLIICHILAGPVPFDPTNCQNCEYDEYGIGFLPDLNNTCNYIRCTKVGETYTKTVMPCPAGTSWKQDLLACDHDTTAHCPGLCEGHVNTKYFVSTELCRTYDVCHPDHGLIRECCPPHQRFARRQLECVNDTTNSCHDPCGICPYTTDPDCANIFINNGIKQHCGPNQHFNDVICACEHVDNCNCCPELATCDFEVPMNGSYWSPDGWVYPPAAPVYCNTHPDGCFFTTDAGGHRYLTSWRLANSWNSVGVQSVYIEFDMKPETNGNLLGVQGILTNENCLDINQPSIKIMFDSRTSQLLVDVNGVRSARDINVPVDEWSTVAVYYDTNDLYVVVSPNACPDNTYVRHNMGYLKNTFSPLLIGAGFDGQDCHVSTFNGWLKNLCINLDVDNPFENLVIDDDDCLTTTVSTSTTTIAEIPQCPADVVFVVDKSGSIKYGNPDNWDTMLDFFKNITRTLKVDEGDVRIGAVTFHNSANVEFYLDAYSTRSSIIAAIDGIYYSGGGTDIGEGIEFATDVFGSPGNRPLVRDIMIVITDGNSNSGVSEAAVAKAQNIHIMGVGVTSNIDEDQILDIVSGTTEAEKRFNYVHVDDFEALATAVNTMISSTCR